MFERLLELIAPDECLICQKEGSSICRKCADYYLTIRVPACPICNTLSKDGSSCKTCRVKSKLSGATIPYRYNGVTKELISQMKYEGRRSVARQLGSMLPEWLGNDYILTYVPADGPARRRRGFDQAKLIARGYGKAYNTDVRTLLVRKKHNRQVGKNRAERIHNVQGNFVSIKSLDGANVLLVDDVITTGATASECAKALKQAGACKVWLLAVAKG